MAGACAWHAYQSLLEQGSETVRSQSSHIRQLLDSNDVHKLLCANLLTSLTPL